jgi:hypothetical protein
LVLLGARKVDLDVLANRGGEFAVMEGLISRPRVMGSVHSFTDDEWGP